MQDGELFITGRLKDLIIIRGLNHYPQDIELTVGKCHPRVRPGNGAAFAVEIEGRERLVVVHEIERRQQRDLDRRVRGHPPRRGRRARAAGRSHRADQGRQHSQNIERQDPAARLPPGFSGRHAGSGGRMACLGSQRKAAAPPKATDVGDAARRWDARASTRTAAAARPTASRHAAPSRARNPAMSTAEIVLEHVRRVAKERAVGITLDSSIVELGLDSLERMEIIASLEETYGGRFPEDVMPQIETCREVAAAVEAYLGPAPRIRGDQPVIHEVPPENYRFECFPEYLKLRQTMEETDRAGFMNPYFKVHERVINDTTVIDGREMVSFSSYNYVGMSGDPVIAAPRQAGHRSLRHQRFGQPAGFGRKDDPPRAGTGDRRVRGHRSRDRLRRRPRHERNDAGPPVRPRRPDPARLAGPQQHHAGAMLCRALAAGPFPHNDWEALDKLLAELRPAYRRVVIAIEGVYSMDGDIPDVPRLSRSRNATRRSCTSTRPTRWACWAHGRGIGEHFDDPSRQTSTSGWAR